MASENVRICGQGDAAEGVETEEKPCDDKGPDEDPEDDGTPGTPSHKAKRWEEYKRRNGTWSYERWSDVYDKNMERAKRAHEAVDKYHKKIQWGKREVSLKIRMDGEQHTRRLDIADKVSRKGIEYKTGYQTANESNLWEIARDRQLVKEGWQIDWVMEGRASKPLLEALKNAGIGVK